MDLKKDLDEYLLLQSDQKKTIPKITLPSMSKTKLTNWFQKEEVAEDSWFQETKKECCPSLTRVQRITLFILCIIMGIIWFSISLMYIPLLLFKARKFALLFTLGSLFFVLSFFFLWGPIAYLKHMFSKDRMFLTVSYGGTLLATLYCALSLQNTPLTVLCAVGQIISLFWTVFANIPGGTAGISLFTKIYSRSAGSTLPI